MACSCCAATRGKSSWTKGSFHPPPSSSHTQPFRPNRLRTHRSVTDHPLAESGSSLGGAELPPGHAFPQVEGDVGQPLVWRWLPLVSVGGQWGLLPHVHGAVGASGPRVQKRHQQEQRRQDGQQHSLPQRAHLPHCNTAANQRLICMVTSCMMLSVSNKLLC